MFPNSVIRMPARLRLCKADRKAVRTLIRDYDETPVAARIGPEGEVQVRCLSGELINLAAVPQFRTRVALTGGHGHGPLPPAPAAALAA